VNNRSGDGFLWPAASQIAPAASAAQAADGLLATPFAHVRQAMRFDVLFVRAQNVFRYGLDPFGAVDLQRDLSTESSMEV
jgi:hypothetical protein